MKNISARWIALFVAFALFPLGSAAAYNYYRDPFTMFRRDGLYYIDRKFQRKVGAGILRTEREAEALSIGNSYTANANPELISDLFGQKTLVMSQWGLSAGDIDIVTRYALRNIPTLRTVFLSSPIWGVCNRRHHESWPLPLDLYYGYYWSDIEYLLSMETTNASWEKPLQFSHEMGKVYSWWDEFKGVVGDIERLKDRLAKQTQYPHRMLHSDYSIEDKAEDYFECYKAQVSSLANSYPNIQFYVFNPPHQQWFLHNAWLAGDIDAQIKAAELIGEYTSTLPNVRYFDFYSAPAETVMHCRNYRDLSHFDLEVTDFLFKSMANGDFERTPETNAIASERSFNNVREKLDCS